MKRYFILILLLVPAFTIAQQSQLDSLLKLKYSHPEKDSVRVHLLNEIAYAFYSIQPDSGLANAMEAAELAKALERPDLLARAYNNMATNYWAKGEDSLSLVVGERALQIHRETANLLGTAKALNNLALDYYNQSDFVTAIQYHEEALDIFVENQFEPGIIHSYNNMGVVFMAISDYPKAMECFIEASRHVTTMDSTLSANILTNISLVYKNMKNYQEALDYQMEALGFFTALGNKQGMANAMGNIGNLYDFMEMPEIALEYYDNALEINRKINNKRRVASDLTNIGVLYKNISDYDKAYDFLTEAIVTYKETNDKGNLSTATLSIAELFSDAPDAFLTKKNILQKDKYDFILDYQLSAKQSADESKSVQRQSEVWEAMSRTYESKNDLRNALSAYKQYILLRDSVFTTEKEREIDRLQMQYEFDKKETLLKVEHENEQALAKAEIKRHELIRNIMAGGGGLVLMASVGGYFMYKKKRDAEARKKNAEFKSLIADTELKALRSQLNPHFIFNSLNSISDFMLHNNLQDADYYLGKFAKLMRLTLEKTSQNEISLQEDLMILELYMQLEALRLRGKFVFEIKVDEDIDPECTLVPPLLLQPYVENSIWHGVSKKKEGGKILINVHKKGDFICYTVEDNGVGRVIAEKLNTGQTQAKKTSKGMGISEDRIAIFNQIKKAKAKVSHIDLEEGFKVELELPLV